MQWSEVKWRHVPLPTGRNGNQCRAVSPTRRGQKEAITGRSISRAAGRGAAAGRAESSRDRMGSCARECTSFRRRSAPESRKSRYSRDSRLDSTRLDSLERPETARRVTRLLSAIINIDARTLGSPLSARCDFAMRFGASRPPLLSRSPRENHLERRALRVMKYRKIKYGITRLTKRIKYSQIGASNV